MKLEITGDECWVVGEEVRISGSWLYMNEDRLGGLPQHGTTFYGHNRVVNMAVVLIRCKKNERCFNPLHMTMKMVDVDEATF